MRVLLTGWAGFLRGEATAGDVLSLRRGAAGPPTPSPAGLVDEPAGAW